MSRPLPFTQAEGELLIKVARKQGLPVTGIANIGHRSLMVCRDYFPQFTPTKFVEKIRAGELKLPLVRLGPGQKAAKGVPLNDLAAYLDNQIDAARKDLEQMHES